MAWLIIDDDGAFILKEINISHGGHFHKCLPTSLLYVAQTNIRAWLATSQGRAVKL